MSGKVTGFVVRERSRSWRYSVAIISVVVGFLLRHSLQGVAPDLPTYIAFYPAVMITAIVCGLGPGILATALSALAADYWILPPAGFRILSISDMVALAVFCVMGVFISSVAELYRRTWRKTVEYEKKLALAESEERFHAAFERGVIPMALTAIDGTFLRVNPAFCEMVGFSEAELIGRNYADITHPDDVDRNVLGIQQAVRNRQRSFRMEKRYIRKDRKTIWADMSAAFVPDAQGNFQYMVTHVQDITERKRAEDVLREQAALLDMAPDAIVVRAMQDRIVFWNRGAEETYGWKAEEATGQVAHDLLKTRFPKPLVEIEQEVIDKGRWEGELTQTRKDGQEIVVSSQWAAQRDPSGHQIGFLVINRDITDHKRAEEELKRTAHELVRSNRDLEQFAYVASHDLQEPLRMVSGHLEIIQARLKDKLDETTLESMSFAVNGALRMQALIRDLLAYSRAGREMAGYIPTDMNAVLASVLSDLSATIEQADADIQHDPLPAILAEPVHMAQLFQNLIDNAIKYRAKDRRPQIRIAARREERGWVFSVQDNGIGIAPEYLKRVFQIFQRLHPRQDHTGTGIGLAICKRIVEYHGGRLWVDSVVGQGSTFSFFIPDRP